MSAFFGVYYLHAQPVAGALMDGMEQALSAHHGVCHVLLYALLLIAQPTIHQVHPGQKTRDV